MSSKTAKFSELFLVTALPRHFYTMIPLLKSLLPFILLFGCGNCSSPREPGQMERTIVLERVKSYLQRQKLTYPGNCEPIWDKAIIAHCDVKSLLQKKPIFFDGLERGFVEQFKDKSEKLGFVGIPISAHRGIIVAIDSKTNIPISYGWYFIGE